jgi:hypothetical protein
MGLRWGLNPATLISRVSGIEIWRDRDTERDIGISEYQHISTSAHQHIGIEGCSPIIYFALPLRSSDTGLSG